MCCYLRSSVQGMARRGCRGCAPRVGELWLLGRVGRHVIELKMPVTLLVGVYCHRHVVSVGCVGKE